MATQPGHVTKTERDELRRLAKASFEVVHEEVAARERDVKKAIADQLDVEFAAALKKARAAKKKIRTKIEKLNAEIADLVEEMGEAGLATGYGSHAQQVAMPPLDFDVADRHARENKMYREIAQSKGFADLNLRKQELNVLIEIAQTGLVSNQANAILKSLPDAEKLVPANGEIPGVVKAVLEQPLYPDVDDDDGEDV